MTHEQIHKLVSIGEFPESTNRPELIETHISWVLICKHYVYKLKKPIQYLFLDFSTVEKRKYYCEREVELNKRFSDDMYIDVLPVRETEDSFFIGGEKGSIIDYAVRMVKQDNNEQMNVLLLNNEVVFSDVLHLAEIIAAFHERAAIIYKVDLNNILNTFKEINNERTYLSQHLSANTSEIISHAISVSDSFIKKNQELLLLRLVEGFYRDGHGDLHTRNIFLNQGEPKLFDCIEFNDAFRQIDVLNDIAFLCMDLDAFGRQDMSDLFLSYYNRLFPCMNTHDEYLLYVYYKSYRANVRAQVNSLRAKDAKDESSRKKALSEANKYLLLLNDYSKFIERELTQSTLTA